MRSAPSIHHPLHDARGELRVRTLDDLPPGRDRFDRVVLLDDRAAHDPEDALERAARLVRHGGLVLVAPRGPADLERVRDYATWIGLADACILGRVVIARRADAEVPCAS